MQEQLLQFIVEELGVDQSVITYDTSLFKDKLLDSMNLTFIIAYIEDAFGITVSALDVVFENFDTIENIATFIVRKKDEQ